MRQDGSYRGMVHDAHKDKAREAKAQIEILQKGLEPLTNALLEIAKAIKYAGDHINGDP